MGLSAERDFGAEEVDLAFPDIRFRDGDGAVQVVLPPGPTAAERFGARELANRCTWTSADLLQPWIELEWLRVEKLNMLELGMSRVKDVDSLLGDDD